MKRAVKSMIQVKILTAQIQKIQHLLIENKRQYIRHIMQPKRD